MKILLIGYGRMGRLIEQTAAAAGDTVAAVVDIDTIGNLETMDRVADVAVDFSNPAALPAVAAYVRRTGTPLLSGTTGMTDAGFAVLDELGQYAPVLHSANYSVGVAVFRRALEAVSDVLKPDFDIEIMETHHNQKVDAPSGTAKLLLEAIDPTTSIPPSMAVRASAASGAGRRSASTPSGAARRPGPTQSAFSARTRWWRSPTGRRPGRFSSTEPCTWPGSW